MVNHMRAAVVKVREVSYGPEKLPSWAYAMQVFSTKHSLTLPAAALEYIEGVLKEVSHQHHEQLLHAVHRSSSLLNIILHRNSYPKTSGVSAWNSGRGNT